MKAAQLRELNHAKSVVQRHTDFEIRRQRLQGLSSTARDCFNEVQRLLWDGDVRFALMWACERHGLRWAGVLLQLERRFTADEGQFALTPADELKLVKPLMEEFAQYPGLQAVRGDRRYYEIDPTAMKLHNALLGYVIQLEKEHKTGGNGEAP